MSGADPLLQQEIDRHVFKMSPGAWFETYGRIVSKEVSNASSEAKKAPKANYLQVAVSQEVAP